MSNAVLPTLPGLDWNVVRTPEFATKIFRAVSGKEVRAAMMAYPLWTYSLDYEFIRKDTLHTELDQLAGFFLLCQGSLQSFLYLDPEYCTVTSQQFGIGDGTTTGFQLVRSIGGFVEPTMNLNGVPVLYDNGGVINSANYTIDSTGYVTLTTPPTSGHVLTWTGGYYHRCRFLEDTASFSKFMQGLWELKGFKFVGAPGNKV